MCKTLSGANRTSRSQVQILGSLVHRKVVALWECIRGLRYGSGKKTVDVSFDTDRIHNFTKNRLFR